ncbi:MAG: type II toxin-antitoxin system HicB family antitoxin [Candidatus Sungbacteria bacterium]|uniref:Type II toxin-antitoxin system HicB family antitoxin n=1 Tax=Candidatus Sungiibacteriota bacterium TaxID=2750080 RepID=A0A931YD93_9BACT|nr:type II toxin-antitoxin system HicB family antitoxin [Candidatus Sungbacteria bacterium]MBI2465803.1 type II toxin-antitoxin system HicB family antitoxin [Candidatus Sungbacteria bacterium]
MKKQVIVKTKYGEHRIVLEKDERGYMVIAPGLECVVTWGKNINHAKAMAKEAIELHIECIAEEELIRLGFVKKTGKKTVTVEV